MALPLKYTAVFHFVNWIVAASVTCLLFFFFFLLNGVKLHFIHSDGIPKSEWHPKKLSTMNGFSPARIHRTITTKWYTKNATIMVYNSHNRKAYRYSHCNRSHWKRKSISHRHRLLHHGNYIKHNRSSCRKWKAIINCIRIEPKVIENRQNKTYVMDVSLSIKKISRIQKKNWMNETRACIELLTYFKLISSSSISMI